MVDPCGHPVLVSMMFGTPATMPLTVRPRRTPTAARSMWWNVWRNTNATGRNEAMRCIVRCTALAETRRS